MPDSSATSVRTVKDRPTPFVGVAAEVEMAKIRVGVRKIQKGTGYEVDLGRDDPAIEVMQLWVEIDGHRIDAGESSLLGVEYSADPKATGVVTVRFASGGFETVDHREPPPGAES